MDPKQWDALPYYLRDLYRAGLELQGHSFELSDELRKALASSESDGSDSLDELGSLGLNIQTV